MYKWIINTLLIVWKRCVRYLIIVRDETKMARYPKIVWLSRQIQATSRKSCLNKAYLKVAVVFDKNYIQLCCKISGDMSPSKGANNLNNWIMVSVWLRIVNF